MRAKVLYSLLRGGRLLLSFCAVLAGAALFLGFEKLFPLASCQFAPAFVRFLLCGSLTALAALAVILLLTLIFGRVYCSFLCPLGSFMSFIALFSRKGAKKIYPVTGGLILGLTFGYLVFGLAYLFRALDPYSLFGRSVAAPLWFGLAFLLVILAVTLLFGRVFCTSFCQVGLILSLFARKSLFRFRFSSECVGCGQCAKVCPAGCLDVKERKVKNAFCLMCLDCFPACPKGGLSYEPGWKKEEAPQAPDLDRRKFLVNLAAGAAVGLAAGGVSKLLLDKRVKASGEKEFLTRPPGAMAEDRFLSRCTACGLCAAACPRKIITLGPLGGAPRLNFKKGSCDPACAKCSNVCPAGALKPLTPEKKRTLVIGKVSFEASKCIAFQGGECGKCASWCPTNAITLRPNGTPKPEAEKCVGCGGCENICPAGAMRVKGVPIQYFPEDATNGENA